MIDPSTLEIGLCWGTLQRASLLELIEVAGRHGFPTLSVRPDTFLSTVAGDVSAKALRQKLRDAGVRVRVIDALTAGLPGSRAPEPKEADNFFAASTENCLDVAEALEAPIINVCHYSYFGGAPVPLSAMIDTVGDISRKAKTRGLRIAMEFVPNTGIPTIQDALAIAQGVAMDNCGILLDPWHLVRSGGTLEDVQKLPPRSIGAFQLDDRTAPPPGAAYVPMSGRDLPGEGELPLIEITRAALANNPDLTAEVEVFSQELRDLSLDDAAARVKSAVEKWRTAL